jgi:hypothetical protein
MPNDEPTREYPMAYFLHSPHATFKTLQTVFKTPNLLKQRKAWLPGYLPAANSKVTPSPYGFGEWQEEDEVRGIVHYVWDEEQERKLMDHVRGECEVQEVNFEICVGGVFGRREWICGCAFVTCAEQEREKGPKKRPGPPEKLEEIREEVDDELANGHDTSNTPLSLHEPTRDALDTAGSPLDAAHFTISLRKQKRKAIFRRITDPLGFKSAPPVQQDKQSRTPGIETEGARRKGFGLFRRTNVSTPFLPTYGAETGESSDTIDASQETAYHQDVSTQENWLPRHTSLLQFTDSNFGVILDTGAPEIIEVEDDQEVEDNQEIEVAQEDKETRDVEKTEEPKKIERNTESLSSVRGMVAQYEKMQGIAS